MLNAIDKTQEGIDKLKIGLDTITQALDKPEKKRYELREALQFSEKIKREIFQPKSEIFANFVMHILQAPIICNEIMYQRRCMQISESMIADIECLETQKIAFAFMIRFSEIIRDEFAYHVVSNEEMMKQCETRDVMKSLGMTKSW